MAELKEYVNESRKLGYLKYEYKKMMKVIEILCTEQIGKELARYVTVLQICV